MEHSWADPYCLRCWSPQRRWARSWGLGRVPAMVRGAVSPQGGNLVVTSSRSRSQSNGFGIGVCRAPAVHDPPADGEDGGIKDERSRGEQEVCLEGEGLEYINRCENGDVVSLTSGRRRLRMSTGGVLQKATAAQVSNVGRSLRPVPRADGPLGCGGDTSYVWKGHGGTCE